MQKQGQYKQTKQTHKGYGTGRLAEISGMLASVNGRTWLLTPFLTAALLWGQSRRTTDPAIFPILSYGPNAWSLLRLENPADSPKSVQVDVYRHDGTRLPIQSLYRLKPRETVEIRIEDPATDYESCWARVADVSNPRSRPSLLVSAREEEVKGNHLEEYPQTASLPATAGRWVTDASAVSERKVLFLNISGQATALKVCGANSPRSSCDGKSAATSHVTANPRQSVVLRIATLRKPYLVIESSTNGAAIIGLLRPESGTSRVYSSETSVTFDDPARP
jgi:hypothetical protein